MRCGRTADRLIGRSVFAPPSALPGITPTRGRSAGRDGFPQQRASQPEETVDKRKVKALANLPTCGGDGRQARGGLHGTTEDKILPTPGATRRSHRYIRLQK
ncbi:hypothetical protein IE4803_CH02781 [Rhizobium etli bv. phaseoli str. IE4803]|nr:hypothetical protein IE4803_CH02781 [Rhizobium etli bv. phaseoli str. IE4803]